MVHHHRSRYSSDRKVPMCMDRMAMKSGRNVLNLPFSQVQGSREVKLFGDQAIYLYKVI